MTFQFFCDYASHVRLKSAATRHGAGEAELAAIERMYEGTALQVDVERLEELAKLADLPWREMFPEAYHDAR